MRFFLGLDQVPVETTEVIPDMVAADPEAFERIGEEISEQLDFTPSRVVRRITIRRKARRDLPPMALPCSRTASNQTVFPLENDGGSSAVKLVLWKVSLLLCVVTRKSNAPSVAMADDGRGVGTAPAGSISLVFMGIGSCGVHFVWYGDDWRHPRISGILMESRHSVADGESVTGQRLDPGNPVAGVPGQVFVHSSHVCQIGATDQGHFIGWE